VRPEKGRDVLRVKATILMAVLASFLGSDAWATEDGESERGWTGCVALASGTPKTLGLSLSATAPFLLRGEATAWALKEFGFAAAIGPVIPLSQRGRWSVSLPVLVGYGFESEEDEDASREVHLGEAMAGVEVIYWLSEPGSTQGDLGVSLDLRAGWGWGVAKSGGGLPFAGDQTDSGWRYEHTPLLRVAAGIAF